ncbi:MAG: hypothetical protein J6M18_00365 [Actinomycetaceae bacterium]|nr:hypothetical protein [Actinomycetaceae bacterium]
MGKVLEAQGHSITYALGAFDDVVGDVNKALIVGFVLIVLFLLIGGLLLFINARAYIRLSRRDIGLLLHYGYTRKHITRLYRRNIVRIFLYATLFPLLIVVVSSYIFLTKWVWIAINVLSLIAFLVFMYLFISYVVIRPMMKMPILNLLKYDQEFA